MARNPNDDSETPVRARESSHKRSPSRREKFPARHKSSYRVSSPVREKPSSRTRSPRHAKSRSPEKYRVREKPSSRTRSPGRAKSRSPVSHPQVTDKPFSQTRSPRNAKSSHSLVIDKPAMSRSPEKYRVREKPSSRTRSPGRARSPVSHSQVKDKPLRQTRSPRNAKSSHSPVRDKPSGRAKSPRRVRSRSPAQQLPSRERASNQTRSPKQPKSTPLAARSPSPRTKRLRRANDENEAEKANERAQKMNHRGSERSTRREKDSEREEPSARRDKKSGSDVFDNGSSRSKRGRSSSPSEHHHMNRHRSRSPTNASERQARDEVINPGGGQRGNTNDDSVAQMAAAAEALENREKQKPSFELSGKLAEETNRFRGITLLFNEAPDARKPDIRWRLYVFKGGDVLNEPLYVHRQTSYLFGRERRVADIPTDHPSCSKQHAVLQYRQVEKEQPDGNLLKQVRPYIMDLGSTNGTFINDERIDPQRYYELREKDTIKFGNSSREYVLLHENSAE